MIRLYQPYSVEEILALRTVFSAYGSAVFPIIKEEIEQSSGTRRAVLLALMNFQRSGDAAPFLIGLLKDSELRVRASALRSLAYLFNSDDSNEPGRQTLLEGCVELLEKNKKQSPKLKEKWTRILTNRQMTDAFCLLALSDKFTVEERLRLYKLSPNLFENVTPEFKTAFGEFLLANRGAYLEAFRKELAAMKALQPGVEQACAALLGDSEARVKVQATAALGEMRAENYFDRLTVLLDDGNMQVKEAAGAALAHFGIRTYRFYDEKFDSAPEEARALMITSASQAREEPLPKIIIRGLKDKSNLVRATAVSAILNLRPNLEKRKKKLISGLHAKDGYLR
jgi:HEAT repeat protein